MYDLIDRPIDTLPAFERIVLDATRRWVHAFSLAGQVDAGADDALGAAMHALNDGSTIDIVIRRPCFPTVDEMEAVIVCLWRMIRDGDAVAACDLAETLVDRDHAARLIDGMGRVVAAQQAFSPERRGNEPAS